MILTAEERLKELFCQPVRNREKLKLWFKHLEEYRKDSTAIEQFSLFLLSRLSSTIFLKTMERLSLLIPTRAKQLIKEGVSVIYKDYEKAIIDSEQFAKHLNLNDIVIFDRDMDIILVSKYIPAAYGYKNSLETSLLYSRVGDGTSEKKKLLLISKKFDKLLKKKLDSIDFIVSSHNNSGVEKISEKIISRYFYLKNDLNIKIAVKKCR